MDYNLYFSCPLVIAFLFLIFMSLTTKKSNKKLPPGPKRLPIIGNLHQLIGSDLPHQRLRDLSKKYGPLMHLQLGQVPHIVISSPEAAREVMKAHDIAFSGRPIVLAANIMYYNARDLAFTQYGNYWRQVRKICILELLSAKRVQSFKSIREEQVSSLVNSIAAAARDGEAVNLSRMITSLSYYITSRATFGMLYEQHDAFIPLVQKIVEVLGGFSIADVYPSFKLLHVFIKIKLTKMHREADLILENIIKQHSTNKVNGTVEITSAKAEADDLIDVLLNLKEHGDLDIPLTNTDIKAIILDMFLAGSETSSTTIQWAMSEMLKNPHTLQKAQEEVRQAFSETETIEEMTLRDLKYLHSIINETLRMHPPIALIPRASREKTEVNGYEIPDKANVFINTWAIGRDPNHWTEPETFNPDRFNDNKVNYKGLDFEFIPFGAGRRICPGTSFGLSTVELALANLLYHFDWKLPNGAKPEDLDMTEAFGAAIGRKNALLLIPVPYNP